MLFTGKELLRASSSIAAWPWTEPNNASRCGEAVIKDYMHWQKRGVSLVDNRIICNFATQKNIAHTGAWHLTNSLELPPSAAASVFTEEEK